MLKNPRLFEVNTRVWIKQFEKGTTLSKVPIQYFKNLAGLGIDVIWFMGIWKTCTNLVEKCCFSVELVSGYSRSLKDWRKEDVIGSPFAIDVYEVSPELGDISDLIELRSMLNSLGIKLMLDFIPNHFGADSEILMLNPEIFLKADEEQFLKDPYTFFKFSNNDKLIFAHGRDPLFPAWTDTVQVNYFSYEARDFMTGILLNLSDLCDGVRCDMAMLQLNNVFQNTWLGVLNKKEFQKPGDEFWQYAIARVKEKSPEFIFLAEAYWDLEWQLHQLGFDFTYDKRLTDRLASNDVPGVKAHLMADNAFQIKSARMLENHDEPRAVVKFGKKQSYAAAVLISTIQGMKFFYDGQFEGKKVRLPVQLGREPQEKISDSLKEYYSRLLSVTKPDIFRTGEWKFIDTIPVSEDNSTYEDMFAWQWKLNGEFRIVVINYSESTGICRVKFDIKTASKKIKIKDELTGDEYLRSVDEIRKEGLYVELKAYHSHILSFIDKAPFIETEPSHEF